MNKSVKRNYIFNLVYQLLLILIPIISIPYLSRVLLEEGVGIFSYSESIVSYFTLFAILGSTTYAQREVGKVQNSVEDRSRVFWEIFLIRLFMTVISLAAYSVYLSLLGTNFIISLIFGLNIVNVLFDITWFYQGIEEFGKVAIFGLVSKILDFAFIFIFVKQQSDLWIYTLGKCGFLLLGNVGLWILLPKKLCKTNKVKPFKHVKTILAFFIPTIAIQVYTMLDKSMIGWITGSSAENGYYEYAEKIIRLSITVISALSTVLIPRIAKAHADGDTQTVQSLVSNAVSYVWLIGIPLMFGFLAVSDVLVPIYLGENFEKSILLMNVFSPLILFVGMANIIGLAFLIPINKQFVNIISIVVAAVINVILNCILIRYYASVGAAISSVIAEGIGITIQCTYVFKKKLFSFKRFIMCSIRNWISGAIMFVVLFLLKYYLLPVAVWSLIVLIVTGIVVYFALLFVLRDKFLMDAVKKAISILKHKQSNDEEDVSSVDE